MDQKRDGEWRAIAEEIAKSQKITARWARECCETPFQAFSSKPS
ncbi:MAG: hypothetical protein QXT63_02675 [Thermoplasmata archaeon]